MNHVKALAFILTTAAFLCSPGAAAQTSAQDTSKNILAIYTAMKSHDIILKVGSLAMTKGDFQKTYERLKDACDYDGENNAFEMAEAMRTTLKTVAQRGACLLEVRALKLEVTPEEQKAYEDELLEGMRKNGRQGTIEGFRKAMGTAPSTLAKLNYADTLKLVKLQKTQVTMTAVSQEELTLSKNYLRQVNDTIKKHNHETELDMQSYLADKSINTDEGFKKLAMEFSQGTESAKGGVLEGEYTRGEIAEVNEGQPFTCKVGETTSVIVTKNNYRIMRVLKEIPPKDGEAEPRYKVAQILRKRFAENDVQDDGKIRENLESGKRRNALDAYAKALTVKYLTASPLFPEGLWQKK